MLRELSLAGRIQVFKALALSKAMFICTMKPYSKKFLDDLNEIQKDFIWRGRKPKIKHTSLIGDHSEGGMKDIDIKGKLESLRIQWVISLTNNNFHSWKIIPNFLLKDVGGVSLFHSNLALSDACKLKIDNYPEFYKSIVYLWIKISATDPQSEHDILSQTMWSNKYILIKRKPIFFLEFYQKGINTINDLIDDERKFYGWNRLRVGNKSLIIHKFACHWFSALISNRGFLPASEKNIRSTFDQGITCHTMGFDSISGLT